ncbi:MAG: hypothetical protein NC489_17320 [Ruminococcus flavefaciens]|nr:hypothetical protein [Ruminococcus flavefaciens]
MKTKESQKATVEALDVMIRQVEKGPSGFWVEDHEGCGNPKIFPEFEEGLEKGRLIQKEHYLCPWNTAVLYGKDHGNINTGCYHSCSINKAKFLSEELLKKVLIRFRKRLIGGAYDCKDNLSPLLTSYEISYIEKAIQQAEQLEEKRHNEKRNERLKKAAALIAKYPNEEPLLAAYYGEKNCLSRKDGIIFFKPDSLKEVVGAENMSYDEYLDVQLASLGHEYRSGFANGLFNYLLGFKGQIEKINAKHICFKRIFISGMYPDGVMFDDKEDHVWMEKTGFEEFAVGDSVSFCAEVYRYVKTGKGKLIDYGLRNPEGIKKTEDYQLPSDDELRMQMIEEIICETCYLSEHCNRVYCLLPKGAKKEQKRQMLDFLKGSNNTEGK